MGCFVALVAMTSPRLAMVIVWVFTDRVSIAFDTTIVPLVGLFFLPWTTLIWTLAYAPARGVTGAGWLLVAIALLSDLGTVLSSLQARRQQQRVHA